MSSRHTNKRLWHHRLPACPSAYQLAGAMHDDDSNSTGERNSQKVGWISFFFFEFDHLFSRSSACCTASRTTLMPAWVRSFLFSPTPLRLLLFLRSLCCIRIQLRFLVSADNRRTIAVYGLHDHQLCCWCCFC